MTKYISREFIDILLSNINIINIVGSLLTIEKRGTRYYSLCPFHNEKTPSFFLDNTKQRYYCFGCNSSGDIIQFIMKYKSISFVEAVILLSSNTTTPFLIKNSIENKNVNKYSNLMKNLSLFYVKNLIYDSYHEKNIHTFLNKRKIKKEMVEFFNLGFAPNQWLTIVNKFPKNECLDLGLILKNKNGNYYDHFRNRLIFPIKNKNGNIIGFGGRTLIEECKPKYLNSFSSKIFSKKKELYGLYEAIKKSKSLKQLIIVEGFLDVIALHQYNIFNVVATLGTAFTLEQLNVIKSLSKEIVFCYDGDEAGKKASWQAINNCISSINTDITIKIVSLPMNEDPETYIKFYGRDMFLTKIKNAISLLTYIFNKLSTNIDLNNIDGKIQLIRKTNILIKKIENYTYKHVIFHHLKKLINLNEKTMSELIYFKNNQNNYKFNSLTCKKQNKETIISHAQRASILLIKNKTLCYKLNVFKNFDIVDFIDIIIFFKIIILLNLNKTLNIPKLKQILFNDLFFVKCEFYNIADNFSSSGIKKEFDDLLVFIINYINRFNLDKIIHKSKTKVLSKNDRLRLNALLTKNLRC